jgi:PAS domain S-box-containing protein
MRVGELARRTGVGVSTLRAWERRFGFLEPVRSPTGQRLYSDVDLERVSAVCRLVAEGLTLSAAVGRVASAGTGAMSTGEDESLLLHQVIQAADQGLWVSRNGRTRYVNRRMAEMMGCSIDELMTRRVFEFIDPELVDMVRAQGKLVRAGQRLRFEMPMRRADGSTFLAEVSTTPLRMGSGAYEGAVAVVNDITARSQADAEARFRNALLDAIGEAVLAALPDGTIMYANPAAEGLFGWRASELVGRNGLQFLPAPDATARSERIHSRLLTKRPYSGEIDLARRDGSHFAAHLTGAPVLDNHGELKGVIAVLSDVTERDRLEHEVHTHELQAETVALFGAKVLRCDPDDADLFLTEAVEATRRVLGSELAALFDFVEGGDELELRLSSPIVGEPIKVPSGSRSFLGYTALAGKVVLVDSSKNDRRFDVSAFGATLGITSAIAAPVFGPSGVSGVLVAANRTPEKFQISAAHFMQNIANVVGTALRRRDAPTSI